MLCLVFCRASGRVWHEAAELPKPMTSNSKAQGRFGEQDFRYAVEEDV